MKTIALPLALFLPAAVVTQTSCTPQSSPLVFTHVTVIDVGATSSTQALRPNQTVIITRQRITAVGETGKLQEPAGAQVVDATGKFLMPGLWDMHVHMNDSASFLKLFLANGVTGVRDMGSDLQLVLDLREQIASGAVLGPRIVTSGPNFSGMRRRTDHISTAEEARAAVRQRKQAGADFIKLHSLLPPDAFFAAVDEANKQGLTAVGHVTLGVKVSDAAKAGLKSIEHLEGVLIETNDLEDDLRQEISVLIREGRLQHPQIHLDLALRYRDSYSPERAQRLAALFADLETWQCPTIIGPETQALASDAMAGGFVGYPNLRYIPLEIRESRSRDNRFSPAQVANLKVLAASWRELAAVMHRAGVPFLAGTDAYGGRMLLPGFSLHDELSIFVQVGFSSLEALQTATINPARFLDREDELGTVEPGKLADLVLLDANPLDDIANTRRISAVVVNGRLLQKDALQRMLDEVEAAANGR